MAEVALAGVHKRYPATPRSPEAHVVRGLDLTVGDGEIVCLLGGSGCGKTTTLRMIAGLETVDEGTVHLGGSLVSGPGVFVPPERRRLGMVFQSYAIWPHLDVFENVAFPLRQARVADPGPRVARALEAVHLGALARRRPSELSGGQQQRVAIARALVAEPQVLLLDEPLSNLDTNLRHELRDEIRALVRRLRLTAVLVTHDQDEAATLGDRIALIDHGRVIQCGPPRALFLEPRTSGVASFLGVTNRVPGVRCEGGVRIGGFVVPARALDDSPSEGPCFLGFRDDAARLGPEGVVGRVEGVVWSGSGERATVRIGDVTATVTAHGCSVGDLVHLTFDAAYVMP